MSLHVRGRVIGASALAIVARLPFARVGAEVDVYTRLGIVRASVVAIEDERVRLAPLSDAQGIAIGDIVTARSSDVYRPLGMQLLGRAVDGLGHPLDGRAAPETASRAVLRAAPSPGSRVSAIEPMWTGVRTIDSLFTFARGARIGIIGPAGCGKTTLLDTLRDGVEADAVVVALVGERGREAERVIAEIDERTTVVCATSDRSPGERVAAAEFAVAQAERLRDLGLHVVLVIDSLTRYAAALREIDIALGDPIGPGGYPPAVFGRVAGLLERAGALHTGSITLIATVLCDVDEQRDPLAEAARALLDGHLVLSRAMARRGHYPAIDPAASLSRTMSAVVSAEHGEAARVVRCALVRLEETREARDLGILAVGDRLLAGALAYEDELERFLRQAGEPSNPSATLRTLSQIADRISA